MTSRLPLLLSWFAWSACIDAVDPDGPILCTEGADCPSGHTCAEARHECVPDGQDNGAPVIQSVAFTPSVTNGVGSVTLVVTADRALDPAVIPTLEFADGTPPLLHSLAQTEGGSQALAILVDDVADGAYPLVAITVAEPDGDTGRRELVDVALVVDRSAPTFFNGALDAPLDGRFADTALHDLLTYRTVASEPLARAALEVGGVTTDCAVDVTAVACAVAITNAMADGADDLVLTLVDIADNTTTAVAAAAVIDVRPPALVPDAAEVRAFSGAITLRIVVDEDVSLDFEPDAFVDDFDGVHFARVADGDNGDRSFSFTLAGAALPPGATTIRARLTDVVGHTVDVDVAPVPPIATCAGSPTRPACFDLDDDGYAGIDSCPAGEGGDADDRSPLVFPGALEIPGDGVDNDGIFGEAAVSDDTGVFVDSLAGDDSQSGAMFSPVNTLDRAAEISAERDLHTWFLAARDEPYTGDPTVVGSADLVGGLDADTWLPVAARSKLDPGLALELQGERRLIAHIDTFTIGTFAMNDPIIALFDVNTTQLDTIGSPDLMVVMRSHVGEARITNVATVHFFESDIDRVDISSSIVTISHSQVHNGVDVNAGGNEFVLTISNSVLSAGTATTAVYGKGGTVSLFHNTIFGDAGPAVIVEGDDQKYRVVGNVLVGGTPSGALDVLSVTHGVVVGNAAVAVPLVSIAGQTVALSDVNACNFSACEDQLPANAHDNVEVDAGGFASLFHLAATSPLRDGGFDATAVAGAPTSVIVDFDYQCRYADGAADHGVDEVVE